MIVNNIYIDDTIYNEKLIEIKTILNIYYPDLNISGPYMDLYVSPMALMLAYVHQSFYDLLFSFNLNKLYENIKLFSDEEIDDILSFYGFIRQNISNDILPVIIYFNSGIDTFLPANTRFLYNDKSFILTSDTLFSATESPEIIKIFQNNNTYYSYIQLQYESGEDITLDINTPLTLETSITNIKEVHTLSNFVYTAQKESNEQFVSRALNTYVPPATCSKSGLLSYLYANFNLIRSSIISCGDIEMLRDADNIFQLSLGGKVDVYIQSDISPVPFILEKQGILIDEINHIWQIYISADELSGIYHINKIVSDLNNEGSLEIVDIILNQKENSHYISSLDIYTTKYANIEIRFKYDITNNSPQTFYIYCYRDPLIPIVQTNIDTQFSPLGLDILIKSYYPLFLLINCDFISADIDENSFKTYLISSINQWSLSQLTVSNIIELIHEYDESIKLRIPLNISCDIIDCFKFYHYDIVDTLNLNLSNKRLSENTIRPILLPENITLKWS